MGLSVKYFYLTMMLVLVLTPLGRTVNGSTRWIPMLVFNVQVSEVAKLCLIAYLAGYAVRRRDELLNTWPGFLKPLVRSEEHTSESSHVRISYAVFCLKKKNTDRQRQHGLDQL